MIRFIVCALASLVLVFFAGWFLPVHSVVTVSEHQIPVFWVLTGLCSVVLFKVTD